MSFRLYKNLLRKVYKTHQYLYNKQVIPASYPLCQLTLHCIISLAWCSPVSGGRCIPAERPERWRQTVLGGVPRDDPQERPGQDHLPLPVHGVRPLLLPQPAHLQGPQKCGGPQSTLQVWGPKSTVEVGRPQSTVQVWEPQSTVEGPDWVPGPNLQQEQQQPEQPEGGEFTVWKLFPRQNELPQSHHSVEEQGEEPVSKWHQEELGQPPVLLLIIDLENRW